jgi:RNA polymerase sigma-70 factor (ECF subfamily)
MSVPTDTSLAALALTTDRTNRSSRPSAPEEEVAGLFGQLRNPLLRYVLSFGLRPHEGDEVIQEVFLSLFHHVRQGKSRQNLRGWLFCVAHNLALKHRYPRSPGLVTSSEENLAKLQDRYPNPEESLAAKQRQERLLAVVRALPEQDRCCLHLRAEGLRYREIAGVLGMSLGMVSVSLVRSLARLNRADKG